MTYILEVMNEKSANDHHEMGPRLGELKRKAHQMVGRNGFHTAEITMELKDGPVCVYTIDLENK